MEGELVLLGLNQAPSFNAVLKALKREESTVHNCVASIADDALFVQQVAARYTGLPLFPNLRCGLWYVRPPITDTCYFKSTDGHNGNWSFSTVRLNLNVAQAAAAAGGCLIVDATKRGKRFPDALSKTVPMWAAVLNRAVARLRAQQQQQHPEQRPEPQHCSSGEDASDEAAVVAMAKDTHAAAAAAAAAEGWDCDVHLPPWVSENEANSVRQRLEGWVDQLFEVGADLAPLARTLRKPLRCMWVSQDSRMWGDSDTADVAGLAFSPIVLVGASATTARQRRCLTLPPEEAGQEALSVSYSYFPGAADDEESWSCGLTPELMWCHLRALLAAGPGGAEPLVHQLLEEQQQHRLDGAAAQASSAQQQEQQQRRQLQAGRSMLRAAAAAPAPSTAAAEAAAAAAEHPVGSQTLDISLLPQPAEVGLYCLLPAGCRPAQPAAVQRVGLGIFLLGDTGLAISNAAAAAAPAVWQHVDAVMHLGLQPLAGMQQEGQPGSQQQAGQQQQLHEPQQQQPANSHSCAAHTDAAAGQGLTSDPADHAACRYCWLPVRSSKAERHALQQHLPAALRFAAAQLHLRRRLLLCCDSGSDISVCAALACLLAFYQLDLPPGGGATLALVPAALEAAAGEAIPAAAATAAVAEVKAADAAPASTASSSTFPPLVGAAGFSKLAVRQHLAAVSTYYPAARPTRGSLRQVFNFFHSEL